MQNGAPFGKRLFTRTVMLHNEHTLAVSNIYFRNQGGPWRKELKLISRRYWD